MNNHHDPPTNSRPTVPRYYLGIVVCGFIAFYILSKSFFTARHNAQLWEMTNRHNAQLWEMTERHNAQLSAMLNAQADKYQARLDECRNGRDRAGNNEAVAVSGP